MKIVLSNTSKKPIYEQIRQQMQSQILDGTLEPELMLPSIRKLARDLGVSVITVNRAYDDLEKEGYIYTIAGKGSYVAGQSLDRLREKKMQMVETRLERIVKEMQQLGVTREDFDRTVSLLWEEDES